MVLLSSYQFAGYLPSDGNRIAFQGELLVVYPRQYPRSGNIPSQARSVTFLDVLAECL